MTTSKIIAEKVDKVTKLDKGKYLVLYLDGSTQETSFDKGEYLGLVTTLRHRKNKEEKLNSTASKAEIQNPSDTKAELKSLSSELPAEMTDESYPDHSYEEDNYEDKKFSMSILDAAILRDEVHFEKFWSSDRDMNGLYTLGVPAKISDLVTTSLMRLGKYGNPGESIDLNEIVRVNELTLFKIPKKNAENYRRYLKQQAPSPAEGMPDYLRRGGMEVNNPASGIRVSKSISRT